MTDSAAARRKEHLVNQNDNLHHAEWCIASRVETTDYPERQITTTHCVDCGAHEARDYRGNVLRLPTVTGGLVGARLDDMTVTMEPAGGAA